MAVRVPLVSRVLTDIAERTGVRVELEPEFLFAGRIIFPDGHSHVFRASNLNVNLAGSAAIAGDKSYTSYFLRQAGLRVPRELTFFSDEFVRYLPRDKRRSYRDACKFAETVGYPVVVKPNDGKGGALVNKAGSPDDIVAFSGRIFAKHDVALVQEFVTGNDYRIVVLDGEIISAYRRIPLQVVGDGISTIEELILRKQSELSALGRADAEIDPSDPRIDNVLGRSALSRNSVLPDGQAQYLLDNANLSSGGTAEDITSRLDPSVADIAIKATRTIGLNLCGVDLVCPDATRPLTDYTILELNAAPGLDNYASVGAEQAARVEELFVKVIRFLERSR